MVVAVGEVVAVVVVEEEPSNVISRDNINVIITR